MKTQIYRGADEIEHLFRNFIIKDLSYLLNKRTLRVSYLLLSLDNMGAEELALVEYEKEDRHTESSLLNVFGDADDFDTALEGVYRLDVFIPVDPAKTEIWDLMDPNQDPNVLSAVFTAQLEEDDGELIDINFGDALQRKLKFEEVFPVLCKEDVEAFQDLFLQGDALVDDELVEQVIERAEECNPDMLDSFLGYAIFGGSGCEPKALYEILKNALYKLKNKEIRKVIQEKIIYAYAYIAEQDGSEESYAHLKKMLSEYVESIDSPYNRAFAIYEVITIISSEDVKLLKDILFSFDRYIPYTESFSPLIFGDLGMTFHGLWEESRNPDHRELAVVLLQKSVFSTRELFKMGNTEDFPLNLSNFFAYMSTLIPLLEEEILEASSVEVKEEKRKEVRDMVCLGIDLLLEFSEDTDPDVLSDHFPSYSDAQMISEGTKDNFVSMMEAFFETDLYPEAKDAWNETIPENTDEDSWFHMEDIIEGALKVREIVCDRR